MPKSLQPALLLAFILVTLPCRGDAPAVAIRPGQSVQGTVHREGDERYQLAFPASGTATVTVSGFPADCAFQVGSRGFQDGSPVAWTDGEPGRPVRHSFRVSAGKPGEIWVTLKPRASGGSLGDWCGVAGSVDGPYYTTPDREGPAARAPATFEGRPVRPPITFSLVANLGGGETPNATGEKPERSKPAKPWAGSATPFKDDLLGFGFDYPEGWVAVGIERGTYRISGPEGSPEAEVTLVITIALRGKETAWQRLMRAHADLTAAGAEVTKLGPAAVAGQRAPYAAHAYSVKNAAGQTVPCDSVQIVLENDGRLYFLQFAGPHDVFVKNAAAMQLILKTWRF